MNSETGSGLSFGDFAAPLSVTPAVPLPVLPFNLPQKPSINFSFGTSVSTPSTFGSNLKTPGRRSGKPAPPIKLANSGIRPRETTGKISERYDQAFFEWGIPDFLSQDSTVICSPSFPFLGCLFYVSLHLNVKEDCVSISLGKWADDDRQDLKDIVFTFAVKKLDGTQKWKDAVKLCFSKTNNSEKNLCWRRQELVRQKSELLPSGALTVAFSVQKGIPYSSAERMKCLESLSSDFKAFFLAKSLCDVILKVQGVEFQAHKSVLAARSSVFASAFQHDMSEKETGIVDIDDCDPQSFGDFLKYLYVGEIGDVSFKTAHGLYVTADKYNVQDLKWSCTSQMLHHLEVHNVCDAIALADLHDETGLLSAAEDYFCRNYSEIVETVEWELLMRANYRLANKVLKRVVSRDEVEKIKKRD